MGFSHRWKGITAWGVASLAVLLGGCSKKQERVRVVVTMEPLSGLTKRIAGEDADVERLLAPGADPRRAPPDGAVPPGVRVAVAVGLGLDDWVESWIKKGAPKARVLKVGDRVPSLQRVLAEQKTPSCGLGACGDAGDAVAVDPYVWLDPQRTRLFLKAIAEELARADGAHAAAFRRRADALDGELDALDHELEKTTAPWVQRSFVTDRARLGYFAERYRLDIVGVVAPKDDVPPSEAHLKWLVDPSAHKKPTALVFTGDFPFRAQAQGLGLPARTVDVYGGGPGTDTYEGLLRKLVGTLGELQSAPK